MLPGPRVGLNIDLSLDYPVVGVQEVSDLEPVKYLKNHLGIWLPVTTFQQIFIRLCLNAVGWGEGP